MSTPERDEIIRQIAVAQERQGHAITQILWQIKGNEYPEIEGIIPAQKRIERRICDLASDVSNLKAKESTRGTFTYKTVLRVITWVIGTLGTIGGLFSVYFQIFGH